MLKKLLVFLFLLFFSIFVLADSLTGYTVPNNVPLNKNLTIYGTYSGTPSSDVLCAFYVFDVNNTDFNQAIIRLSDQYTFSDGSFYSEYRITEPLFRRGIDYNAITKCGSISIGKIFHVAQSEEILFGITSDSLIQSLLFWTDPNNSVTVVFIFFFILLAGILIAQLIGVGLGRV